VELGGLRRDARDHGMSIRALARRHGVHRRTVHQASADATRPAQKVPERLAPATSPYVDLVRRWLTEDGTAPKKQRQTARLPSGVTFRLPLTRPSMPAASAHRTLTERHRAP
jgi:hypothetical protein